MSKLYVVGTPIGNLEDITLRALRILKEVDYIACEDTRVTHKLLLHFEISNKKLLTYNNYTEKNSTKGILNLIESGHSVALVSDAGMPVVSDPGFEVIKQAKQNNIEVEIIPGVNAAIVAFVGSNFDNTFTFCGFMKDKSGQRINYLQTLSIGTYIFYVSPHKLEKTLLDLETVFGESCEICLAKELTKIHENWFFGKPREVLEQVIAQNAMKGEFTLVLNIPKQKSKKISKYAKGGINENS
ncbi:16S rRNA (cytidine(1402)-2'-O)-methyltransferase [Mycoplasmopsis glycophila]|uniref:Ribosomal RNA small subunit methyltransferase I n=1 Tax=Mycoplasmopsis glycophila TaxID=171285 RepID=A0A449AU72_9BACT|nr:16S rRNA (cytidine(1402)-2'-O)-methyltransferase [Mycoplasmopsis glycophila]VEU70020.1 putative SAM-dependent methyltransferase [Mycoplasmopsis glycophila]